MHKRICVTGGAGSIGSELVRQLHRAGHEVFVLDLDETRVFDLTEELGIQGKVCDVTSFGALKVCLDEFRPNLVFHCAAFKHVTPNESEPENCIKVNVFGTLNVIKLCKKYGIKMVNISTDKTVVGDSIMGITKKLAEKMVKNAGFVSVRFGNVLGSRGSVISIWERQLLQHKPITITHPDCERFMMTIPQAVELVVHASEVGKPGNILVLDMGEPVKITDFVNQFLDARNVPDHPIQIIGLRPGETLIEKLWSDDEHPRKEGKFYIID